MKCILLTGGCGYIGSHCVLELLLLKNIEIVIVDNLSNSDMNNINNIKNLGNIHVYNIDLKEKNNLNEIFKKHSIDVVIHLAGYKSVGESVENPLKYYSNNINSLIVLLKCMKKNKVNKIIFSSSATVYGNPEKLPLIENSNINLLNPYGRTKYYSEEILKDMKDFKVICLRYFNPVGSHSSGLLKESPKGKPNNLFPFILSVIEGKQKCLNIYGKDYPTPDGTGIRDYIHVVDLAKGHLAAIKYINEMKDDFDIFNLGTGNGYSVLEVVKEFEKQLGKDICYKFVDRRMGDSSEVFANCEKAEKILKWKAQFNLKTMIKDFLNK